jgi:predicted ABC-type ATPase
LKQLYELSASRFHKVQEIIIRDTTNGKHAADSPVVVILGAQPGAGKTELERITRAELGGNVVNCNADIFRDFHPQAEEIKQRFEEYYPQITAPFAQEWNKGLREYCEANRLNYILETTFSSGQKMNETIAALQQKGYRVEIKLLAVHPKLSLLSTHVRFEDMRLKENTGRLVGKEVHDNRYYMLAPTLFVVQGAALYNKLQLYGRSITMDGNTYQQGVSLLATNPSNGVQLLQEEIDRKWTAELKAFFDDRVHYVIDLKAQRNAPKQEMAAFRNEMKSEYPTQLQLKKEMEQQIRQQEAAELLQRRLAGELPRIDIAGNKFIIDWRLKELRENDAPHNRITFEDMQLSPSEEQYVCYYNTQKHRIYDPPANIKTLPKNVVLLEIPHELKLDPVAVAREQGFDPALILKENPIQKDLTAVVKPLSESRLPKMIEENLEKEQALKNEQILKKGRGPEEDLGQGYDRGPSLSR